MKIRVLWVAPHEKLLKCGKVYDFASETEAKALVSAGEAEPVADDVEALADPRPQPEPEETAEAAPETGAAADGAPADGGKKK